jgi:SnoaL-like domain
MNNDTAEQAFTRLGWAIDRRDWHAVRDVLAASIAVDYTELFGGEPASMSREDLTEQWRANLGPLDATQHVIANVQASVNDDGTVHATANVVATHVRAGTAGSPIWTVGGWYDAQLSPSDDGYAISSLKLHPTWQTGNFAIMTALVHAGNAVLRI